MTSSFPLKGCQSTAVTNGCPSVKSSQCTRVLYWVASSGASCPGHNCIQDGFEVGLERSLRLPGKSCQPLTQIWLRTQPYC